MKIYYTYRFKTEDEFIKLLGDQWRTRVNFGWDASMNDLIGKSLEVTDKESLDRLEAKRYIIYKGWTITTEMLIKNIEKIPNYKPKRIKRSINN